jgi:hypothetical protein
MRFVIEGRLRRACGLSPAEYFALAVREWEMVLTWLASGIVLAYGRPVSPPGGTLLVDVPTEADARALAAALPLAPYADVTVRRSDPVPAPAPPATSAVPVRQVVAPSPAPVTRPDGDPGAAPGPAPPAPAPGRPSRAPGRPARA